MKRDSAMVSDDEMPGFLSALQQQKTIILQLGEQFLYGNSVSPYCFPLPSVPIYLCFFSLYYSHICTVV